MNLDEKLSNRMYKSIWQQYCGFLDLSLSEYMAIQERLMLEQIALYAKCPLGRKIMDGAAPQTLDEFRAVVPLTTYRDYADILLENYYDQLPLRLQGENPYDLLRQDIAILKKAIQSK